MPQRDSFVETPVELPVELGAPVESVEQQDFRPDTYDVIGHLRREDPLFAKVLDYLTVLREVGGLVSIIAHKEQLGKNEFVLKGFGFRWDSYAPPVRAEDNGSDPEAQTGD